MDFEKINKFVSWVAASESETFVPVSDKLKVGLDLGTAYIVLVVMDENNNPVACEKQAAGVLRDGVVVDYIGALDIVRKLKSRLEKRLNRQLFQCAIAMPAGTKSSVRTHQYVAEGAGFEVKNILDEPTGGTHLTLVLAGNRGISFQEAEAIKQDYSNHAEILPVVKAVVEKMASIVEKYIDIDAVKTIYLCGGTCCLTGIEDIFTNKIGIKTVKPENPFLVTPAGIAISCEI